MRLLHLSDTHLLGADGAGDRPLHQGVVDTTAQLQRLLTGLAGVGPLDAVVVSGDVSDDGSPDSYTTARDVVGGFAAEHGAVPVFAMGNHDVAAGFTATLGPTTAVHRVGADRVVVLDSAVPGKGYGHVPAEQLRWLREVLAAPAEGNTVVVVHHPPLPAPTVLHEALRLQHPDEFLDALAGTDVRVVLAGHYHHPFCTTFPSGLVCAVAPGVANRADVLVAAGRERAVRGCGSQLVDVDAAGVRVTVLGAPVPDEGTEIFELDEAAVRRIAGEAGVGQTSEETIRHGSSAD